MSEDITLTANFIKASEWFQNNRRNVLIAIGAAMVVTFGVAVAKQAGHSKQTEANAALISLSQNFDNEGKRIEAAPDAYFQIAAEHAGTAAAERAALLGAGRLFIDGKFAEAKTKFDAFMTEFPSSAFLPEALLGVAAATYAQGDSDQAIQAYSRVVTSYGASSAANQARLALAKIYETKEQPKEALRMYDELTLPTVSSAWSSEAEQAKNELFKLHPELKPAETNAVPSGLDMPSIPTPLLPGVSPTGN